MDASRPFWRGAVIAALLLTGVGVCGARGGGDDARARRRADVAVRLPEDVVYDRSEDSPAPVRFRHWTHVPLAGGSCLGCHPEPFRLLEPTRDARHEQMDAGLGCGSCHDGQAAFATSDGDACLTCHGDESPAAARPEGIGDRLLGATPLPQHEDSPGVVRFDHETHVALAGTCSGCHPEPYPMAASGSAPSKEELLGGASCGRCHDGETAFGADDERCERCHGEEEP